MEQLQNELKQWERTRSPGHGESDDDTVQYGQAGGKAPIALAPAVGHPGKETKGHRRNSSEYSGDWAQ
jgi:hypothetical protein